NVFALAIELHLQNRSVEFFLAQGMVDFVVIELDIDGLFRCSVNDGRNAASAAQAAARTRSLYATQSGVEFHGLLRSGGNAAEVEMPMRNTSAFFVGAATSPDRNLFDEQ